MREVDYVESERHKQIVTLEIPLKILSSTLSLRYHVILWWVGRRHPNSSVIRSE